MRLRRRLNYLERRLYQKYSIVTEAVMIPMRNEMFDYSSEILKDENGNIIYKPVTDLNELLKHAAIQSRLNL